MALIDEQLNGAGATEFLHQLAKSIDRSLGSDRGAVQVFVADLEDRLAFVYTRRHPDTSSKLDCMEAMRIELSKHLDNPVIGVLARQSPKTEDPA